MSYSIRRMEQQDIKPMIDLGESMWSEGAYSYLPYSKSKCEKLGEFIIRNPNVAAGWVAVKQSKIIGMIIVSINKMYFCDEKICNDLLLYVDPKERKSVFVPIKLINKATEWAKEQGAVEFCPASSVAIASDRVAKLYKFLKFDNVGNLFKKRL